MIYEREDSRATIEWRPDNEDIAEDAMIKVVGDVGVEVDTETAKQVRERYNDMIAEDE